MVFWVNFQAVDEGHLSGILFYLVSKGLQQYKVNILDFIHLEFLASG